MYCSQARSREEKTRSTIYSIPQSLRINHRRHMRNAFRAKAIDSGGKQLLRHMNRLGCHLHIQAWVRITVNDQERTFNLLTSKIFFLPSIFEPEPSNMYIPGAASAASLGTFVKEIINYWASYPQYFLKFESYASSIWSGRELLKSIGWKNSAMDAK